MEEEAQLIFNKVTCFIDNINSLALQCFRPKSEPSRSNIENIFTIKGENKNLSFFIFEAMFWFHDSDPDPTEIFGKCYIFL